MAIIQSSDLDFDAIKENLKTYLKRQATFEDYDFEASGLSNILDVLAYNTHINGLIANFALNESFLGSAQLRSSVVSHAETLGYYSRSKTASTATVKLQLLNTGNTTLDAVTITGTSESPTTFTTSVDDVSYTFRITENYVGLNDGSGNFTFRTSAGSDNIVITEGTLKTKTFLVGNSSDEQVYVIPDETTDTATLVVKVFDSPTSSNFTSYTDINNAVRINSDSTVYIVREVPNGFFEVTFSGGNVLGKSPQAGNKIVIEYLSATGAAANGATVFTADAQVSVAGVDTNLTVTKLSTSGGGAEKESISSIKANAPVAFATQQRLVTAEDFKALISQRYSSIVSDVISWGGNDNIPPIYGRVYVALNFVEGTTEDIKTVTKNSIKSELSDNLGIMSIDTVFADPEETFLEITTSFNFDPDLTGSTLDTTQTLIENTIIQFFTNNLNAFGKIFRSSAIATVVDALSPAILNTSFDIKVQQRLAVDSVTPDNGLQVNVLKDYSIVFPVALSQPDDVNTIISSTNFTFEGVTCTFINELNSTKMQIIDASANVLKDNAGSYNPSSGVITLSGINITAFEGDSIKFSAKPADQNTIKPLRNYILKYDTVRSRASGTIDFGNTAVTIS